MAVCVNKTSLNIIQHSTNLFQSQTHLNQEIRTHQKHPPARLLCLSLSDLGNVVVGGDCINISPTHTHHPPPTNQASPSNNPLRMKCDSSFTKIYCFPQNLFYLTKTLFLRFGSKLLDLNSLKFLLFTVTLSY